MDGPKEVAERVEFRGENLHLDEVGFSFLKPGFIECYEDVCKVLEENGLFIVYADRVYLKPDLVDFIYRDSIHEHYYPVMKQYLVENESLAMIVAGQGRNSLSILSSLKKEKDGSDGVLRCVFQKNSIITNEEIQLWSQGLHPKQDEITILLTQRNIVHTSDNLEETIVCLAKIFGAKFEHLRRQDRLPETLQILSSEILANEVKIKFL